MAIVRKKVVKRKQGYLYYVDGKGNVCEAKMSKNGNKMNKKEKYFIQKERLKKSEYEFNGKEYDFELKSKKAIKKLAKYVEVKGIDNIYHTFSLTKREYAFVLKHKHEHLIWLIENWKKPKERVIHKLKAKEIVKRKADGYFYRLRKKELLD